VIRAEWSGIAVSDNRRLIPGRGIWRPNPAYKAFKESMAHSIYFQMRWKPIFLAKVSLRLRVWLPARMDTMAIIKAACDAVQLSGAILNDSLIDRLEVVREGKAEGKLSRIVFEVEER
jgi:Holliday junction resolvase RusA-like endonuclease